MSDVSFVLDFMSKIAETLNSDEKKLEFQIALFNLLRRHTEGVFMGKMVRKVTTSIVETFSKIKQFQSDSRLIPIWSALGENSTSLGYHKFMEHVNSLGYFRGNIEFYKIWANHLSDSREFAEVERCARETCSMTDCDKFFGSSRDEENTLLLFNKVANSLTPEIDLFVKPIAPELRDHPKPIAEHKLTPKDPSPKAAAVRKPLSIVNEESPSAISSTSTASDSANSVPTAPVANYSFTTHMVKNTCNLFGDTLPLSQEKEMDDNPFNVFAGGSVKAKSNFFENMDVDDPTISSCQKRANTPAISTPTHGRVTAPTFEVSPTEQFKRPEQQQPAAFTFASTFVVPKVPELVQIRRESPLVDVLNRMELETHTNESSLVAEDNVLEETTHDVSIMPKTVMKGSINPWGEVERQRIMEKAPPMIEHHEFLNTKCPSFSVKKQVEFGGEKFRIAKLIGQGGFAKVFQVETEDGTMKAIKLEMPSCPWEAYVCKALNFRLSDEMKQFVMTVQDIYVFSNASAIVYEYYPHKTLLDLVNVYRKDSLLPDGLLVTFVGIQIAQILKHVHDCGVIHSDVKPDNFVICGPICTENPTQFLSRPFVKLIDWGRAIDMSHFHGFTFTGRAGTNGFDCTEMRDGRPWTYQTDFFGFVGTLHVLIFGNYMKMLSTKNGYYFSEAMKRRYPLYENWTRIFRQCLNIPSCDEIPDWTAIVDDLTPAFSEYVQDDPVHWRQIADRCNKCLRMIVNERL